MRVLVTGSQGFTGHYVTRQLLQAGHDVVGTATHLNDTRTADLFETKAMNLTNLDQVKRVVESVRPDAVIHLAAVSYVGHGAPAEFYTTNVLGTRNLLESLSGADLPLQNVILASSANVYGNSRQGVLTEGTPPAPANDYAVSKLAMEYMALLWADRLPLIITRPFNYTGVGQSTRFLIAKIVDHFCRREVSIKLGNLDISRDFSDVRDVACMYEALLTAGADMQGRIVNLCSGISWSMQDILSACSDITGHTLSVETDPSLVRQNEVKNLQGSNEAIMRVLDKPMTPFNETLNWMLQKQ